MGDKLPDLNKTFVDEPLCYYNLGQGYMCPDSVDGFDDLDDYKDGDVVCSFVKISFDQALADSHLLGPKKRKCKVLDEKKVVDVVEEEGLDDTDDTDFAEWLECHDEGTSWTLGETIYLRKKARREYESWKDIFVTFCPVAMTLPHLKGG